MLNLQDILESLYYLILSLECETCDKSYRNSFLFSYRILYEKLQYLPDILEFALEGNYKNIIFKII